MGNMRSNSITMYQTMFAASIEGLSLVDEPDRALQLNPLVDTALESQDWSSVVAFMKRYGKNKRTFTYLFLTLLARAGRKTPDRLIHDALSSGKLPINRHDSVLRSTPLATATEANHVVAIQALLEKGVDVNQVLPTSGRTALFFAPDISSLLILLDAGSEVNLVDKVGEGI